MNESECAGVTTRKMPWVWLAWTTPLVVGAWVLEPRLATNRPSYGFREILLLLTAILAIPCVYAIGRATGRQRLSPSWRVTVRQWMWSAVAAFASLPVVLSVAGHLVPLPGSFPDDQIPGLEAGLVSAAAAVIVAAVTIAWNALDGGITRVDGAMLMAVGGAAFVGGGALFAFASVAELWVRLFVLMSVAGLLALLWGLKNVILPSARNR